MSKGMVGCAYWNREDVYIVVWVAQHNRSAAQFFLSPIYARYIPTHKPTG